jgi:hypothetical protein
MRAAPHKKSNDSAATEARVKGRTTTDWYTLRERKSCGERTEEGPHRPCTHALPHTTLSMSHAASSTVLRPNPCHKQCVVVERQTSAPAPAAQEGGGRRQLQPHRTWGQTTRRPSRGAVHKHV